MRARFVAIFDELFPRSRKVDLVFLVHVLDTVAARNVEDSGVPVDDVGNIHRRGLIDFELTLINLAGHVIDELMLIRIEHIVDEDVVENILSAIRERHCFHQHAARDKLISNVDRGDTVQNTRVGFTNIVTDHLLKGQHAFAVEIVRARDQVLLVRVFARDLERDEVRALIAGVLLPAARMHPVDITALFGRISAVSTLAIAKPQRPSSSSGL